MRSIALVCVALIITSVFGGFFVTTLFAHDHHHEFGCPFMPGEYLVCFMNAVGHIAAWQHAFTSNPPTFFVYTLLAAVSLYIVKFLYPPRFGARRFVVWRTRNDIVAVPLYQELFSSGILNPKAP